MKTHCQEGTYLKAIGKGRKEHFSVKLIYAGFKHSDF